MEKIEARKLALKKRNELSVEERCVKSELACQILLNYLSDCTDPILFYYPIKSELNILSAYDVLKNREIYFPKTVGNDIIFFRTYSLKDFELGLFNILEPNGETEVFSQKSGICVTPGVAFDKNGNRIGYGKGYYDRFYATHSGLKKVGITYSELIFDEVEAQDNDIRMDILVTERGIYKL